MKDLIQKIEGREKMQSTSDQGQTKDEIKKTLHDKGQERRQVHDERLKKYDEDADDDRNLRRSLSETMTSLAQTAARTVELQEKMLKLLEQDTEERKAKRQRLCEPSTSQ